MSKLSDSEIEQWVLREIGSTSNGSQEICVFSHNGVVTLRGTVKSSDQKVAVSRAAQISNGVQSVIDEVRVKRFTKSSFSDLKDKSSSRRRTRIPSHHSANLQSTSGRNVEPASNSPQCATSDQHQQRP
jgi:osmotically-inducible protein OsmY